MTTCLAVGAAPISGGCSIQHVWVVAAAWLPRSPILVGEVTVVAGPCVLTRSLWSFSRLDPSWRQ